MTLIRRLRGLVGTALIRGEVGALVGVGAFVAVFRHWPLNAVTLPRASFALARRLPSGSESGLLSGPPADGVYVRPSAGASRVG
jgi:hypothetical protein